MKTFVGTKYTKKQLLDQVRGHTLADEIVQGTYWEDGKGCCVGCWVHGRKHVLFESYFGIPQVIAYLADSIFEGLEVAEAKKFPLELAEAIPEGVDLSMVWPRFAHWLLVDTLYGVDRFDDSGVAAEVAELYQRVIDGGCVSEDKWLRASRAAWAASDAASGAASDAASGAARAAARAARDAARAAWGAARAAWGAAWAASAASDAASAASAASAAAWAASDARAAWDASDAASGAAWAAWAARDASNAWDASAAASDIQKTKLIELLRGAKTCQV